MKFIMGLLVIIVLVLGGYFFLSRRASAPAPSLKVSTESSVSSPAAEIESSPSAALTGREIKVQMGSLKFDPTTIKIKGGEKVKLALSSTGPHTFTVDALDINWALNSGESQTHDLTVEKKGTYQIYCATPGHKEAGMVGTLVVE